MVKSEINKIITELNGINKNIGTLHQEYRENNIDIDNYNGKIRDYKKEGENLRKLIRGSEYGYERIKDISLLKHKDSISSEGYKDLLGGKLEEVYKEVYYLDNIIIDTASKIRIKKKKSRKYQA